MRKHGFKVQMSISVDTEVWKLVEGIAERFGVSKSRAVEMCVEAAAQELKDLDKLGFKQFQQAVEVVRAVRASAELPKNMKLKGV